MKIKLFTLIVLCICAVNTLFAQQKIKGKIIDAADQTPVEFASIKALGSDSTYIGGTISDTNGLFEIENRPDIILSISSIGYETQNIRYTPLEKSDALKIALNRSSTHLNEITVQAKSVMIKDDRKVIIPLQEQIKTASDGADLIRKMQLPQIMVDPTSGEITMSGNEIIQFRINGVQVTNTEVASLLPADILRIEYHDNPGARYGKADAVIDYITRKKESGGNINGVIFNGLGKKRSSADDRLAVKYNNGKSEFSANAMYIQRKGYWTRDYNETLFFPKQEIQKEESGSPTLFDKRVFSSNLNYSLTAKNNYFFNAQLRYTRNDFPNGYEDRNTKLYSSDSGTPLYIHDHTKEISNTPSLDLYYQQNLKNKQSLILNIVGTYIGTNSKRIYQEEDNNGIPETDIMSKIEGKKYSIIAEGIYEKQVGNGKISGGIKHLQSYTHNEYSGTIADNVSMHQAESSLYAEYQVKSGEFGYMVNITGTRLYYSQQNNHSEKYALQPAARLTFEPNSNLYFRYRINLRTNAPSLSTMNNIEQAIDKYQVRRGNPNLDAFQVVSQTLTGGYNKEIWGIDLSVGYNYEFDPIMESVLSDNNKIIRIYENQQSFQNLNAEATLKFKPWKDHLSISLSPRVDRYFSKGTNYFHTYTMSELRVNIDFSYHNWLANFTTITPPRSVYGEQMMKSDQMYTIMFGFRQPKWSLTLGAMNLFTDEYKTDNRNWSALNPVVSKIHTNNNKSILAKFAFNLNYGKQIKGGRKQLNNSDTESGIMQGIKN